MTHPGYTHPNVLVETGWVAQQLGDPRCRFIEVDLDIEVYHAGHIANAVGWDWQVDIQDPLRRNIPNQTQMAGLLSRSGIANDTTIILYGDRHNLFASYAFWLLKYYGHADVRLMNGGRKKWLTEGRPLTSTATHPEPTPYTIKTTHPSLRARREQVLACIGDADVTLVDTRSEKEYAGALLAPEHLPQEGALRGGHIPGAVNMPWGLSVKRDGTFKSTAGLRTLYTEAGISPDKQVIAYCRIGERSSLTWFVLTYLLGYPQVANYDGSWTEWGNLIDVPIEK